MKTIVGERGQATIPKALRERLGIKAGTVLDFKETEGKLLVTKVVTAEDPVSRVYGCLGKGRRTDEVMAELRGKL